MSDKRDDRINDRLEEMSTFFKHSDKKKGKKKVLAEQESAKKDILSELPAEIRFQALQNGMSLEELRSLYAEVKSEYAAKKFDYMSGRRPENNERRQDNVRERDIDRDRQRQRELSRTRSSRSYERQRVHA